jgi:hypothetical protein
MCIYIALLNLCGCSGRHRRFWMLFHLFPGSSPSRCIQQLGVQPGDCRHLAQPFGRSLSHRAGLFFAVSIFCTAVFFGCAFAAVVFFCCAAGFFFTACMCSWFGTYMYVYIHICLAVDTAARFSCRRRYLEIMDVHGGRHRCMKGSQPLSEVPSSAGCFCLLPVRSAVARPLVRFSLPPYMRTTSIVAFFGSRFCWNDFVYLSQYFGATWLGLLVLQIRK